MAFGNRLINTNAGGIPSVPTPDPSSLALSSSTQITGGTYRFSGIALDKVNGEKFYYIRNGGFNLNQIGFATMIGFDLGTAVLSSSSSNFSIGYYAVDIAANDSGTQIFSLGYENSNSNQYITTYNSPGWTAPNGFSNTTNRGGAGANYIDFNNDGTKLYYNNDSVQRLVYEYDLLSPYDVAARILVTTKDLNSVSTETQPLYPGAGWYTFNFKWSSDGSTAYTLMQYFDGGSTWSTFRLKAYNASTAFSVASLTERSSNTSLDISQLNGAGDLGLGLSDQGYFLIGTQPTNFGNQFLYMFS